MNLNDFDFLLPDKLIADRPVSPRSSSKLLVSKKLEQFIDEKFYNLPKLLSSNDLLIFNDTKVIPTRLKGKRIRGNSSSLINATLISHDKDDSWLTLIKPLRKINIGECLNFNDGVRAELIDKIDGFGVLKFNINKNGFSAFLSRQGFMPLPPYIEKKRASDSRDIKDYQSIFAKYDGAVAAPTASLHFDHEVLKDLEHLGVKSSFVTLHVGAGTFLPVKEIDIKNHKMHTEWGCVDQSTVDKIIEAKSRGGRVIPVGTTAMRVLEAAALDTGQINSWVGETDIFIYPGFKFLVCDGLVTNFHLPKSTLMMLVSAFVGVQRTKDLYHHAINNKYRFFSYGDASLLLR